MTAGKVKSIDKADKMHDAPCRSRSTADHSPPTVLSDRFGFANIQQNAGNLAVQRMFHAGLIQAKLAISQPGDPDEQEADHVADQVMRMAEPVPIGSAPSTIQRKCAACEAGGATCPKCEKEQTIQRKEKPGHAPQSTPAINSQIATLRGGGQPLPPSVRTFFEPRFGRDFSQVRVHTDGPAAESTKAIQARAFTTGQHVVFAPGEFMPEGREGRKLLAHELSHVVQTGEASETTATDSETVTPVFRQTTASPGTPDGPDPCLDLLQQIIELLNEVAKRISDALDDKWDLFKYRPGGNPEHPEAGTWDGHRNRYYYDRDRLRQKVAEWESNDDCRAYRLSKQQQEDLKEAEEFKEREFPQKPAKSMREAPEEPSFREKIAEALKKAGIPPWAVAAFVVLVIAAIADPEPFSKVALIIGLAAAVVVFVAIGRQSDVPPGA